MIRVLLFILPFMVLSKIHAKPVPKCSVETTDGKKLLVQEKAGKISLFYPDQQHRYEVSNSTGKIDFTYTNIALTGPNYLSYEISCRNQDQSCEGLKKSFMKGKTSSRPLTVSKHSRSISLSDLAAVVEIVFRQKTLSLSYKIGDIFTTWVCQQ